MSERSPIGEPTEPWNVDGGSTATLNETEIGIISCSDWIEGGGGTEESRNIGGVVESWSKTSEPTVVLNA